LFPGEVNLSIATLPDLSDNVKLIDLKLRSPLSKQYPLPTTVRFELLVILAGGEIPCGSILVEIGPPLLPCGDIPQGLEIVIKEIWKENCQRGLTWMMNRINDAHSWATVAFLLTSGLCIS
jgi:hypothetical protein